MDTMEASDPVLFSEMEFYPLSSSSAFKVLFGGVEWMTARHAYEAAKFEDVSVVREYICKAPSAHEAGYIACTFAHHARRDWEKVKLSIMEEIVRAKLNQHQYVRRKLLETGNREIVEGASEDSFLGKIWMKVRAEISARR